MATSLLKKEKWMQKDTLREFEIKNEDKRNRVGGFKSKLWLIRIRRKAWWINLPLWALII
jgi:hypothetical protein